MQKACASIILIFLFSFQSYGQTQNNTSPPFYSWYNQIATGNASAFDFGDIVISVASDSKGNIYLLTLADGIKQYDSQGNFKGTYIPASIFNDPSDFEFNSKDELYVSDLNDREIKFFDSNGNYDPSKNLSSDYYKPYGVAVDNDDNVYIAEYNDGSGAESTPSSRIHIFYSNGDVKEFQGPANIHMDQPYRLDVDSNKYIYVAHAGMYPGVKVFGPDRAGPIEEGNEFAYQGSPPYITTPGSIVIDDEDYVHIIEYAGRVNFIDVINFDVGKSDLENIRDGINNDEFKVRIYHSKVQSNTFSFDYIKDYDAKMEMPVDIAFDACRSKMYVNDLVLNYNYTLWYFSSLDFELEFYNRTPPMDTIAPVIICPTDITVEAQPGKNFAVVNYNDATATDLCGVSVARTSGLASGSQFPVGDNFVEFTATDTFGNDSTCTLKITVNATEVANQAPTAVADSYSVLENQILNEVAPGVLVNDTDPDGDALTAKLRTNVSNGTLTLDPNGSFTYTPDANYTGPDSFTYVANDGELDSNIVTVSITVNPEPNQAPTAVADSYSVLENQTLNEVVPGVLVNDTDPDGDALTAQLRTNVSNGTLTLDPNGSFTYTPDANYTGPDSFTYVANDGELNSNVVTVTITVNPEPNQAPAAVADSYSVLENQTLNEAVPGVLVNDTDPDGDALTAQLRTNVSNGTLTLDPNGSFTYTPDANYTGQDSFTYVANDGELDSNVVTVSITVNPGANEPPVASCTSFEVILNSSGEAQITEEQVYAGNEDLDLSLSKKIFTCNDIGDNIVTLTVTDPATNLSDSCTATIRVLDETSPQITNCSSANFEIDLAQGSTWNLQDFRGNFTAVDNCDTDLSITQDPAPGTPINETTDVRVRFTDDSGNNGTCLFTVKVNIIEGENLELSCVEDYRLQPDDECIYTVPDFSSIVSYSPSTATIRQSIPPGTELFYNELGDITVTATYNDQEESCVISLLQEDKAPVLVCPSDQMIPIAEGESVAMPDYSNFLEVYNCGDVEIVQDPSAGTQISESTEVTFFVTDAEGRQVNCSFEVLLVDENTLNLNCPQDYRLNAGEDCIYVVPDFEGIIDYTPVDATIEQSIPSGTLITSDTEITITATYNGSTQDCTILLDLRDDIAPVISCPDDKTISLDTGESFIVPDYSDLLNASDNCGDVDIIQIPEAGSTLDDDIQMTFIVSDEGGNSTSCNFNIDIVRSGEQNITCPEDQTLEFDENCSYIMPDYTINAEVSNYVNAVVQDPSPGTVITENETQVTLSVSNNGQTDSCTFKVTAQDNTPPVIRLRDIRIELNLNGNAVISFQNIDNGSFDTCDADVQYTLSDVNFNCKNVGENLVQVIAEDSSGNTATANTTVTVIAAAGICDEIVEDFEYIFVYPNPNTGSFKVSTPTGELIERIEVFDHRGRFIRAKDFASTDLEYAMHLGPLQEAVYVLKIVTNERTVTKRIIYKY